MQPLPGEEPNSFIMRAENQRAKYQIDPDKCYLAFARLLPLEFRLERDKMARALAAQGESVHELFTWESLVS